MLKTVASQSTTGQLNYAGTWDASANTPTLVSGVGTKNQYYVVSVAGSTNLDGITDWQVGDWAIFNGTFWEKIDQTNTVTSVNGQVGAVVLGVANIAGAVPNTVNVLGSGLITGGGALTGNVTLGLTSVPVANVPGAVPNTVNVLAAGLLTGGGPLTGNVTVTLANVPIANVPSAVPNTVNVLASGLLTGGGALTANVTLGLTSVPVANVPGAVPNTVNVIAGGLLTGGGALTGNVTVSLANVPNANVTGLGTMATQNSNAVTITGGTENNLTYTNVTISSGNVVVTKATAQTIVANGSISASSNVGAFSYGNLTYSDTGIVASYSNAANSAIQVIVQNSSNLANASTDIVVTNDTGIAYADFGVNSSTLTGTGKFYTANTAYLYSGSADLYVGTFSNNAIHFVANNSTTDAMVINANNTITINALNQSTNANATMSTASIPLVPLGYIIVNNNGTNVKIPYYAV